ncbi:DUF808 domain-containing protein [Photobacterium sp. WH77]|uniref:DUF808 domain-containing protein n=1 Tax=Photobacterium arenosum TaxID=2774143 RepID=A0ABR9BPQ9_9GAMM|nr:DUF808 domain-containing protein [Photobacterium arenosum]MBV7264259.1 DUF808 domain-containing protein [Photobacterium sp. WH24]MCG2838161.1 DUF808 domain-containing protein [Photobacterium sp. WH77]MCG2845779.1 DUF808 domain-containing protein [Photobacterium sp. WH80]
MAGASLLTLLDDIATVLDDVAVMSKVAARKTAGVLGDDLALNAQQVAGVRAEREIPVVWAVAKGSFKNKLILVPAALLISAVAPWLIVPLLLTGGLFLCFEGAEKVIHKLTHDDAEEELKDHDQLPDGMDIDEYEQNKIKGAIRTDFILSAEIIVIALGTVQGMSLMTQLLVVSLIALTMTVGVYGLVAGIVKLDDAGFYLVKQHQEKSLLHRFGQLLIAAAPKLMKLLAVVGTIAMFLVGGGIVVHSIPDSHHWLVVLTERLQALPGASWLVPMMTNLIVGIVAGLLVLAVISAWQRLRGNQAA